MLIVMNIAKSDESGAAHSLPCRDARTDCRRGWDILADSGHREQA
jgi:hypothetical protein